MYKFLLHSDLHPQHVLFLLQILDYQVLAGHQIFELQA